MKSTDATNIADNHSEWQCDGEPARKKSSIKG